MTLSDRLPQIKVTDDYVALSINDASLDNYVLMTFSGAQRLELPFPNEAQFEVVAQNGCYMPRRDDGPVSARWCQRGTVLLKQKPLYRGPVLDGIVAPLYLPEKIQGDDVVSNAAKFLKEHLEGGVMKGFPLNPFDVMLTITAYLQNEVTYSLTPPGFIRGVVNAIKDAQDHEVGFSDAMKKRFPKTTYRSYQIEEWLDDLEEVVTSSEDSVEKKAAKVLGQAKDRNLLHSFYLEHEDQGKTALEKGVAKCTGFAGAYVAIANKLCLPSERRSGLLKNVHPTNSTESFGPHAWAVSWIEPYGFVEVDPTNRYLGSDFNKKHLYNLGMFLHSRKFGAPKVELVTPNLVPKALKVLRGDDLEGLLHRFTRHSNHARDLKRIQKVA